MGKCQDPVFFSISSRRLVVTAKQRGVSLAVSFEMRTLSGINIMLHSCEIRNTELKGGGKGSGKFRGK